MIILLRGETQNTILFCLFLDYRSSFCFQSLSATVPLTDVLQMFSTCQNSVNQVETTVSSYSKVASSLKVYPFKLTLKILKRKNTVLSFISHAPT